MVKSKKKYYSDDRSSVGMTNAVKEKYDELFYRFKKGLPGNKRKINNSNFMKALIKYAMTNLKDFQKQFKSESSSETEKSESES